MRTEIIDERTDQSIPAEEILDEAEWDEAEDQDFIDQCEDSIDDDSEFVYRSEHKGSKCRVYYHRRNTLTITDTSVDWHDYLRGWDWDAWGDYNSMLGAFGLEPELKEAEEGYEGPCRIWVEYNYSSSTYGAPRDGWIMTESNCPEIRSFASRDEAQEWISEQEEGTYYLSHGEMGRPAFTICQD